jgi:hypothetical protein
MKYSVKMDSGVMMCILSLITISSDIQKLTGGGGIQIYPDSMVKS